MILGMTEHGYMWIYLIFFLIPLARIIPRLVKKWRKKESSTFTENEFSPNNPRIEQRQESIERSERQESIERSERQESIESPQTKEMQVLGELNKGVKDFSKIQKNLDIDNQKLESILKDLEKQGLMKVIKKKGFSGIKIELYPTDKGFKRYYR
jgi:DNA-binding MarR family transcriptional regulator